MIAELVAALKPLVGGRAYPLRAPQGTPNPFLTFQGAGGQPINTFCGIPAQKKNGRLQVNVWADTPQQAEAILEQVKHVIAAAPFRGVVLSEPQDIDGYDTRTAGAMQDFSIWWPSIP